MTKKVIKIKILIKIFSIPEEDIQTIHFLQLGFIPPIPKF
jgi:hypothetical protein